MCLDIITKRYWVPQKDEFTAYKQFSLDRGELISHLRSSKRTPLIHTAGVWLRAAGFKDDHGFFRTGFYCYLKAPQSYHSWDSVPIIPITVRGLVTSGKIWSDEIVIVREMFIPVNWRQLAIHVPRPPKQVTREERDAAIEEVIKALDRA